MHKPAGTPASFGVGWHSDNSFFDKPSLGSIVYAETVPPVGETHYSPINNLLMTCYPTA